MDQVHCVDLVTRRCHFCGQVIPDDTNPYKNGKVCSRLLQPVPLDTAKPKDLSYQTADYFWQLCIAREREYKRRGWS